MHRSRHWWRIVASQSSLSEIITFEDCRRKIKYQCKKRSFTMHIYLMLILHRSDWSCIRNETQKGIDSKSSPRRIDIGLNPRSCVSFSWDGSGKCLCELSATISPVGHYTNLTFPLSRWSRKKCTLTSICLTRWCCIGFIAMAIVDWLSWWTTVGSFIGSPISSNKMPHPQYLFKLLYWV